MRKVPAALTVLAMAALGAVVPASAAHAGPICQQSYRDAEAGYMYAYDGLDCVGFLGKAEGDDANWGDSSQSFQGGDTNKASSILNKGVNYEVKFYNGTGTGWTGGYTCLGRSEHFASDLRDNTFTSGASANNSISSHRWVSASFCDRWAT
ncbi:hypothetical protein OG828_35285 [Streptomyces sp. NBC_00457]|uniref:hypothetical protein n=1 Tax=Streptomyces sp. NBC_00457 TaxID=2975748 RepID=UPI002E20405F